MVLDLTLLKTAELYLEVDSHQEGKTLHGVLENGLFLVVLQCTIFFSPPRRSSEEAVSVPRKQLGLIFFFFFFPSVPDFSQEGTSFYFWFSEAEALAEI